MWAGRDKNGNRVIIFFCLDVDKSSHFENDFAGAIKLSLEKLTIATRPKNIFYACHHQRFWWRRSCSKYPSDAEAY